MKVFYSPQYHPEGSLEYTFEGDKITATLDGVSDVFDFTGMTDGQVQSYGSNPTLISDLPINPVLDAIKSNGVLSVRLVKFIGDDATDADKFPDWIDV